MTDREKAVVMAYTGVSMLAGDKLCLFYRYVQDKLGFCVMTHELAYPEVQDAIKEASRNDFIELCKSSDEPRVMTLEEVKALPSETDVWLDEFCSIVVAATISCTLYGNAYFYGIEHSDYGVDYKLIDYGKEWRCWTARPTYKQREAEPWG